MKCFINCVGSDLGELDSAGKIMEETAMATLPPNVKPDVAKKILQDCAKAGDGLDKCETSFEQVKCVSLKIMEIGIELIDDKPTVKPAA